MEMEVKMTELVNEAKEEILRRKTAIAKDMIVDRLQNIERCEKELAERKEKYEEILDQNVEDIELRDHPYRGRRSDD